MYIQQKFIITSVIYARKRAVFCVSDGQLPHLLIKEYDISISRCLKLKFI